jgi:hypothetical protein
MCCFTEQTQIRRPPVTSSDADSCNQQLRTHITINNTQTIPHRTENTMRSLRSMLVILPRIRSPLKRLPLERR